MALMTFRSACCLAGVLRLLTLTAATAAALVVTKSVASEPNTPKPNVVFILCDNLGYGDIGCFGSTRHRTPALDGMAREGLRFTSFYSTSGKCTASRASLMTGCYPRRVNLHVSEKGQTVLFPGSPKGLHPDEITVAELLRAQGYATACIGKWHLGDQPAFLPTRHGFDYYLGIPYSEDMVEPHSEDMGEPQWRAPPLPLMEGERVIEAPVDPNQLTQRYTKRAIEFISENRDRSFFLYLAHATPGSAPESYASARFLGKSANGTYGDAVEEMDWSTGEILAHLKRLGLDERTLIVWTSDNGAVEGHGGSCAPFKGWGYSTAEGGMRMPCIARWPGRVPAAKTCDELCTMMDWLPTLARLAGGLEPTDRIIDGKDIRPLLLGEPNAKSPYEAFYFYHVEQLQAVRSGRWKLYLPLENVRKEGQRTASRFPGALYDLVADIGETANLMDERGDVVKRLLEYAEKARADIGDLGHEGKGQRGAGWVEDAKPPRLTPP
jgi:arylsulfatase A